MPGFFDLIRQPPVQMGERYPLFKRISIETTSFCNRKCGFCPIAKGTREEKLYMDDAVFTKVVDELAALEFDGVVQMFLLNEPTLDRRLLRFLREVGTKVPYASVYMSTNGDVLTNDLDTACDKLWEVFCAGCTVVNLNVYDADQKGIQRRQLYDDVVEKMAADYGVGFTEHKYRHYNPKKSFIAITDMRLDRAGSSVVDSWYYRDSDRIARGPGPQLHCARVHRHIVVEHDGRVPICCTIDVTEKQGNRVGNVCDRSLIDIWNDEQFHKYRWFLQQKRRELSACLGCDSRMAYPHVVRRVTAPDDTIERWETETRETIRRVALPVIG
jgi:radical SAM protein with 4Fe4S-binding SPASM domain